MFHRTEMIVDLLPRLHKLKIILASTSPRRIEMMKTLNIKCEVVASSFAEDLDKVGFRSIIVEFSLV